MTIDNNQKSLNQEESEQLKKQSRKTQWQQAAKDPALLKDIFEIESDFRSADAETAKILDE